ncbi:MAG: hypothetical protein HKO54_06405 [Flavobacteriaceae bacterium]|nr:hypothetical protein [Flavobacteriaceae bacterium]
MKNTTYVLLTLMICAFAPASAQVGIGTTSPKSLLDISASNAASPAISDGILIPRIDAFPAIDPGADQDGMLVFLTTPTGSYEKGFHYWDNTVFSWIAYNDEWKDGTAPQSRGDYSDQIIYAQQSTNGGVDVIILDSGQLGIGTTDLEESIEVKLDGDNDIQITSASPPDAPQLVFYTTEGSFAAPDFMNDGDDIGYITGKVWTGTGKSADVSNIQMRADGNHSAGNLPTRIEFAITEPGDTGLDSNNPQMVINNKGNVGIGLNDPTAYLEIKEGTSAAETAPLKLNDGFLLSTPETGAIEFESDILYFTPNTTRKILLTGLETTQNLNFPNIPSRSTAELTTTITGANVGDSCNCAPQTSIEAGLQWNCYVSAANTITVRISNISLVAVNPAAKNWKIVVFE